MRYEWQDFIPLAVVVALIAVALAWAHGKDRDHCHRLLRSARTNTDTLIVISSRRCVLVSREFHDAP